MVIIKLGVISRRTPPSKGALPSKGTLPSKGISPMIATVLLIAFTVAVGGLVSAWMSSFTTTTTGTITSEEETKMYCAYAGISLSDVHYCNQYIWGTLDNSNLKPIGNLTFQVFWSNYSSPQRIYLLQNGSVAAASSSMELPPGESASFNVSIDGSNYDKVRVYTNCSNVDDEVERSYITAC